MKLNLQNSIEAHLNGAILAKKYSVVKLIYRCTHGITYKAQTITSGKPVFIKSIYFENASDWKVLELFEREASVLAQLNHDGIPLYIDSFKVKTQNSLSFYIVQEFIEGLSLEEKVQAGWKPGEANVKRVAREILNILIYLQSLAPPVIHRDITPRNVIVGNSGQIYLVDFGGCRDLYRNTVTCGSTIVGTFGYMAPEQFSGQAKVASDLYGLGTTLLNLLTGKSPADLPYQKLKVDFSTINHTLLKETSTAFQNWLEALVEPNIDKRVQSAQAALEILNGELSLKNERSQRTLSYQTRNLDIQHSSDELIIQIPSYFSSTLKRRKVARAPLFSIGLMLFIYGLISWYFPSNTYHSSVFDQVFDALVQLFYGFACLAGFFTVNSGDFLFFKAGYLSFFYRTELRYSDEEISLRKSLGSWCFSRQKIPLFRDSPLQLVTDRQNKWIIGFRLKKGKIGKKPNKKLSFHQRYARYMTQQRQRLLQTPIQQAEEDSILNCENQTQLFAPGLEQSEYIRLIEEVTDFVNELEASDE